MYSHLAWNSAVLKPLKYLPTHKLHAVCTLSLLFFVSSAIKYMHYEEMRKQEKSFGVIAVALLKACPEFMCAYTHLHSIAVNRRHFHKILKRLKYGFPSRLETIPFIMMGKTVLYYSYFISIQFHLADLSETLNNSIIGIAELMMVTIVGQFFVICVKYVLKLPSFDNEYSDYRSNTRLMYELQEEIDSVGRVFSKQNFLVGMATAANLPIYSFYLIDDMFIKGTFTILTASRLLNVIWQILILLIIITPIEVLQRQIDKFHKDLYEVMRRDHALCSDRKLRLYLLIKPSVEFSACGFFTLRFPLVTSILAAAMTYMIILIQFSLIDTKGTC